MMEGIFICAAPHCLKSFLKRSDFESHIQESHADLLQPNAEKEDNNESEVQSVRQSVASESTLRAPPRPGFSPGSNSELNDRDDKTRRQTREQSLPRPSIQPKLQASGQVQTNSLEPQADPRLQGFDRPGPHNLFQQQNFDSVGAQKQESGRFTDKQQGFGETPFPEYPPMHPIQPPNYMVSVNSNPMLNPPMSYGYPPFPVDGSQPFYSSALDVAHQDTSDIGPEQASLMGFPQGSLGSMNMSVNFPQGKVMDPRDNKGILAPQPMSLPPPPPTLHLSQHRRNFYSSDISRDGQGFGWQQENRESFGSGRD